MLWCCLKWISSEDLNVFDCCGCWMRALGFSSFWKHVMFSCFTLPNVLLYVLHTAIGFFYVNFVYSCKSFQRFMQVCACLLLLRTHVHPSCDAEFSDVCWGKHKCTDLWLYCNTLRGRSSLCDLKIKVKFSADHQWHFCLNFWVVCLSSYNFNLRDYLLTFSPSGLRLNEAMGDLEDAVLFSLEQC